MWIINKRKTTTMRRIMDGAPTSITTTPKKARNTKATLGRAWSPSNTSE
jgi:hypothetical protein